MGHKTNPNLTTDNFRKHTPKNPLQKFLIERFFDKFLQTVKFTNINSVLDVGCGEGFTMNRMKQAGVGKRREGIEYSETSIAIAKKLYPDLNIKQGDIYKLPYKANSFDLVVCTEVLEHLEHPKKALLELVRVSKSYVLLSVPNEPFFMLANLLRGKNLSRWGNDIEHIQHWSSGSFERFVKVPGVKVVSKRLSFPWTIILLRKTV